MRSHRTDGHCLYSLGAIMTRRYMIAGGGESSYTKGPISAAWLIQYVEREKDDSNSGRPWASLRGAVLSADISALRWPRRYRRCRGKAHSEMRPTAARQLLFGLRKPESQENDSEAVCVCCHCGASQLPLDARRESVGTLPRPVFSPLRCGS